MGFFTESRPRVTTPRRGFIFWGMGGVGEGVYINKTFLIIFKNFSRKEREREREAFLNLKGTIRSMATLTSDQWRMSLEVSSSIWNALTHVSCRAYRKAWVVSRCRCPWSLYFRSMSIIEIPVIKQIQMLENNTKTKRMTSMGGRLCLHDLLR